MKGLCYASCKLGAASLLAGNLISLAVLAQDTVSTKRGDANLQNGGRLYRTYRQQCHGSEGRPWIFMIKPETGDEVKSTFCCDGCHYHCLR